MLPHCFYVYCTNSTFRCVSISFCRRSTVKSLNLRLCDMHNHHLIEPYYLTKRNASSVRSHLRSYEKRRTYMHIGMRNVVGCVHAVLYLASDGVVCVFFILRTHIKHSHEHAIYTIYKPKISVYHICCIFMVRYFFEHDARALISSVTCSLNSALNVNTCTHLSICVSVWNILY